MNSDLNIPGGKYTDFDMEQLTLIIVGDPKVTSGVTKCRESLSREFTLSTIAFHAVAEIIYVQHDNAPDKTFDDFIWKYGSKSLRV